MENITCVKTLLCFFCQVVTYTFNFVCCIVFTLEGQFLNNFSIFEITINRIIHVFIISGFSLLVLFKSCLIDSQFILILKVLLVIFCFLPIVNNQSCFIFCFCICIVFFDGFFCFKIYFISCFFSFIKFDILVISCFFNIIFSFSFFISSKLILILSLCFSITFFSNDFFCYFFIIICLFSIIFGFIAIILCKCSFIVSFGLVVCCQFCLVFSS